MAIPNLLKNYIVYIDGIGYAGKIEEGSPPKIALKTEEYLGAGMVAPVDIDMGVMDKMEFDLSLAEHNPVIESLFGQIGVPVTFRGVAGPNNLPVIIDTLSMIKEIDPGAWTPGKKGVLKLKLVATYYKKSVNGIVTLEVDAENMIWIAGGIDLFAALRVALGV